jgi:hypothetical protein
MWPVVHAGFNTRCMMLLLLQEYMLRMIAMGWLVGCLTHQQLSKLAVNTWPYPMRVLLFGTEVMQQRERLVKMRRQLAQ